MSDALTAKMSELERRVARSEFAVGALVRTHVPVTGLGDVSNRGGLDIDVLSVAFDARLRETKTLYECKSNRGQGSETERLLWLAGFRQLVGAERAVLVRDAATSRGTDLARRIDVEIFDDPTLRRHEASFAWLPASFGLIGNPLYSEFEDHAIRTIKSTNTPPQHIMQVLRFEALLAQPHQVLGTLSTLRGLGELPTPTPALSYVGSHALVALLLAALRAARLLETRSATQLRRLLEVATVTGDPYDRNVLDFLDSVDAVVGHIIDDVHAAYVHEGAARLPLRIPSLRGEVALSPPWLSKFVDLAERLKSRARLAAELPQTVDLCCFDGALGGVAWKAPAFDHLFTIEHRQLLAVLVDTLEVVSGRGVSDVVRGVLRLNFDRVPLVAPDRMSRFLPD